VPPRSCENEVFVERVQFLKPMDPDEIIDGVAKSLVSIEPYEIPDGDRAIAAWYDWRGMAL
jgi:hypothetical protein